jgi:peroxiredoxin
MHYFKEKLIEAYEKAGKDELAAELRESISRPLGVSRRVAPGQAPDVSFKSLDGKTAKLSDFKGKVVIVNFWATWAPSCVKEMATLEELYKAPNSGEFGYDDLVVLGISVDSDGEDVVRKYIEERKITYPIIMSTREILDAFEIAVGEPINTVPTTIVIGKGGFMMKKYVGVQEKESLREAYESFGRMPQLKTTAPQPKGTGAIKGTVVDVSPDRNPISGARVMYVGPGVDNRGEVTTDETGNYEITGLLPGQYVLSVSKAGYAQRDEIPATIVAGSETVLEIKLRSNR